VTIRRGRLGEVSVPAGTMPLEPALAIPDLPYPEPRNRLLAALPPEDLAQLWPRLSGSLNEENGAPDKSAP